MVVFIFCYEEEVLMNRSLRIAALTSGISFGTWPLIMKKSGLDGFTAAALFEFFAFLTVVPFVIHNGITLRGTKWWLGIVAAIIAGLGLVVFTTALSKATPIEAGKVLLIMLIVQTVVPAVYSVVLNRELDLRTILGIITAILTVIFLTPKS